MSSFKYCTILTKIKINFKTRSKKNLVSNYPLSSDSYLFLKLNCVFKPFLIFCKNIIIKIYKTYHVYIVKYRQQFEKCFAIKQNFYSLIGVHNLTTQLDLMFSVRKFYVLSIILKPLGALTILNS